MTRSEFLNDIDSWYRLLEFCNDNYCDICDDIISDEDRDDEIDNDVEDAIRNERWYSIQRYLDDIPTGYSYYRRNGRFEYDGLDDEDFDSYKSDVLDWADEEGDIWDDDPEDDEDYDVFAEAELTGEEDIEPAPEAEDFSVGDLMGMCCATFFSITQVDAQQVLK